MKRIAFKSVCLTLAILVPLAAQAQRFGVGIRMTYQTEVTPLGDGQFQVKAVSSSAPVAYWCGIGDYAIRTLGTKSSQRIYVSQPYQRGVRTVQFSMTPPPGADTSHDYSVTVKRVGSNMSAATAQGYCYDNLMDLGF